MVNLGIDLTSLPTDRKRGKEFGDGALLALGCYAVQLAAMVFNNERPQKITASAEFSDEGQIYDALLKLTVVFDSISHNTCKRFNHAPAFYRARWLAKATWHV